MRRLLLPLLILLILLFCYASVQAQYTTTFPNGQVVRSSSPLPLTGGNICYCYEGEACPCGPGCTCVRMQRPVGFSASAMAVGQSTMTSIGPVSTTYTSAPSMTAMQMAAAAAAGPVLIYEGPPTTSVTVGPPTFYVPAANGYTTTAVPDAMSPSGFSTPVNYGYAAPPPRINYSYRAARARPGFHFGIGWGY